MKRLGTLGGGYADRMQRHYAPTALGLAPPPPVRPVVPKCWGPYVPTRRTQPAHVRIFVIGLLCAVACYWLRIVWACALYWGAWPY